MSKRRTGSWSSTQTASSLQQLLYTPCSYDAGRIPVLLDNTKGTPISIMESSAILVYLQEQHDERNIFGFANSAERSQALQWLFFWHTASPVRGSLVHFGGLKGSQPCESPLSIPLAHDSVI